MQEFADLQMNKGRKLHAGCRREEYIILFEIRHVFNENGSETRKKKGELRKKVINPGSRKV